MVGNEKARAALAANPLPPSPWLEVTEDVIIIKAGFSEQLLQLLRWVPKVAWRPEKRYWTVPLAGVETVRTVLPEILRLAELTQPGKTVEAKTIESETIETRLGSARDRFRAAARLMFGGDWQRDTARALGRDEAALSLWLAGEDALEDADALLVEMLALMRRRAEEIAVAADQFERAIRPIG